MCIRDRVSTQSTWGFIRFLKFEMAIELEITAEYGILLVVVAILGIECLLVGVIGAGGSRGRIYNKQYMESNFGEIHKKTFGSNIQREGYPDMGNGFYSTKLGYKEWYKFNCGQRAHYQFVEHIGTIIPLLLITGLTFTKLSIILGVLNIVGRVLYSYGYISGGPTGRLRGAGLIFLTTMPTFVLSLVSGGMIYAKKSL
eukprot:TRINITY_DN5537_c0_g1_i4.p1 TRINITY_DN5537_c0_g1~~TRINITY_DN5537_c0_g1_i4.p1  ORF type:complete len:199 (-),score=37.01 TRINITY_DN5537_c0_g1_i4:139-735(-)